MLEMRDDTAYSCSWQQRRLARRAGAEVHKRACPSTPTRTTPRTIDDSSVKTYTYSDAVSLAVDVVGVAVLQASLLGGGRSPGAGSRGLSRDDGGGAEGESSGRETHFVWY